MAAADGFFEVRILPGPLAAEAALAGPLWRIFGERIRARAVAMCPVGTNQELGEDYGKPHSGEHLKDSIEAKFVLGPDPRIEIGSKQTVGDGISKLALVLLGTDPHPIDPVDAKALRFTSGGQVVFAKHVEHPGTDPNPFVMEAVKQISREFGGVTVSTQ